MVDDRVISLFIERPSGSAATLRVVFERDGELDEHEMVGSHDDIREIARSIAGMQDLVPIWDPSWVIAPSPRPPADRYERRRM